MVVKGNCMMARNLTAAGLRSPAADLSFARNKSWTKCFHRAFVTKSMGHFIKLHPRAQKRATAVVMPFAICGIERFSNWHGKNAT